MGTGAWIAMALFWLGILAVVVWLVVWGVTRSATGPRRDEAPNSAQDVLDRRYAAGDVDDETYRTMRETLRGARSPEEP